MQYLHMGALKWPPFLNDIFKYMITTIFVFELKLPLKFFLRVHVIKSQYWLSWSFGSKPLPETMMDLDYDIK